MIYRRRIVKKEEKNTKLCVWKWKNTRVKILFQIMVERCLHSNKMAKNEETDESKWKPYLYA